MLPASTGPSTNPNLRGQTSRCSESIRGQLWAWWKIGVLQKGLYVGQGMMNQWDNGIHGISFGWSRFGWSTLGKCCLKFEWLNGLKQKNMERVIRLPGGMMSSWFKSSTFEIPVSIASPELVFAIHHALCRSILLPDYRRNQPMHLHLIGFRAISAFQWGQDLGIVETPFNWDSLLLQLKIMSQSFRNSLNSNCFRRHWSSKTQ